MKYRFIIAALALSLLFSPTTSVQAATKKPVPNPTTTCTIKGNISSKKEKIYHLPGCGSYKSTLIDQPGEKYFCTEKEAQKAGWRKAKNC